MLAGKPCVSQWPWPYSCLPEGKRLKPQLPPPFSPHEDVDQIAEVIEALLEEPPSVARHIQQFNLSKFALVPSGSLVSIARRAATARLAASMAARGGKLSEGDFVETGTYTGGTAVVMLKVLQAFDPERKRKFWGFDSFRGFPESESRHHPWRPESKAPSLRKDVSAQDSRFLKGIGSALGNSLMGRRGMLRAVRSEFDDNLAANGVNDDTVVRVGEGWFNETLPVASIKRISFLRLDGDIFVATWDGLVHLYPKLLPGGLVYIDDFGSFVGCRKAVNLYRSIYNITNSMQPVVEWSHCSSGKIRCQKVEAVWWRK